VTSRAADIHAAWQRLPIGDIATVAGTGRMLILSPHPDDESLGCGGLIATLCRAGRPPLVVMLTDGTGSHPGSPSVDANALRVLREREAREATRRLGLPPTCLVFLRLRDAAAPHGGPAFNMTVNRLTALMADCGTICAPWMHDPHCDHVAAYLIARAAAARVGARLLAFPVWGWGLPPDALVATDEDAPDSGWRLDIAPVLTAKRMAIAAHRSQLGTVILDDPNGFSLPASLLVAFDRPYETFLLCAAQK
jgi:LmbE family N-acetylglucosaminyl deacetylase